MTRFRECLEEVLRHEGGIADHKSDPGGLTNKGITWAVFKKHYPNGTREELKTISDDKVERIYYTDYWKPIDGDGLGPGVDLCVFDLAVNSGVGRAKRMFREVMQWHNIDNKLLVNQLCDNRLSFLRGLRTWGVFGKGWSKRVARVRAKSLEALGKAIERPQERQVPSPTPKAKTLWESFLELFRRILAR